MSIASIISVLNAQGMPRKDVDPSIAMLPVSVARADVTMSQRLAAEEAEEHAAAAKAAYEADVAAAQLEYTSSLYAKTDRWRDGDPPDAADLNVSVDGLPPARATLVRFAAWRTQAQTQLTGMEAARERFLTDLGAPAVTQAELDALIAKDKSGFLNWLKSGADQKTKPNIDEFRRQQVEAKLSEAGHAAEVAREGLKALEDEIAVLRKAVELLDDRHPRFARAALIEHAAAGAAAYASAIAELHRTAGDLLGLGRLVGGQDGYYRGPGPREFNISLPAFGGLPAVAAARLKLSSSDIDVAAKPWRDLEKRLIADPRAALSVEPA